jgi:hypothetical protein
MSGDHRRSALATVSTERFTDLFYAPLTVRRTAGSASEIDPMFKARALLSYRATR